VLSFNHSTPSVKEAAKGIAASFSHRRPGSLEQVSQLTTLVTDLATQARITAGIATAVRRFMAVDLAKRPNCWLTNFPPRARSTAHALIPGAPACA